MSTFNSYLNKQMENPEFRAEYEALEPEFSIIQAMACCRFPSVLSIQHPHAGSTASQGVPLVVMTGVPHAIASNRGMPKLSLRDVYRKANAPLYI